MIRRWTEGENGRWIIRQAIEVCEEGIKVNDCIRECMSSPSWSKLGGGDIGEDMDFGVCMRERVWRRKRVSW